SHRTDKTFLFADIYNSTQYKVSRSDREWIATFGYFYEVAVETIEESGGQVLKFNGDAVMAVFDNATHAIQAAVNLQESLRSGKRDSDKGISCKIGIAYGDAFGIETADGKYDYLGTTGDIAARLCDKARGNAILINRKCYNGANTTQIKSKAGISQEREDDEYFSEFKTLQLKGIKDKVPYSSIFWQANKGEFLATGPSDDDEEQPKPQIPVVNETEKASTPSRRLFGKIKSLNEQRGFGYIRYFKENREMGDMWFHYSHIVGSKPAEQNEVNFVIKQGKKDLEARSVVVMGSRLNGKVETFDGNMGYIVAKDDEADLIRFFFLPSEAKLKAIKAEDLVEFTVTADSQGLVAAEIHPYQPGVQEVSGDYLKIGSIERGQAIKYFAERGFGFATCRGNKVFLHADQLRDREQVPSPGDFIEFRVAQGRPGEYRAEHICVLKEYSTRNDSQPTLPGSDSSTTENPGSLDTTST
ncbi:MAG: cold shock domain-containing protein, partial [Deltaproteobacteria bacterium]|nr:cold shock domain-containing protein [Deltaproteobacteria bacterium]